MSRQTSYFGQIAEYGDQITYYPTANLMLPPKGPSDLCRYPEALLNVADTGSILNSTEGERSPYGYPIALLVSMGGCEAEQKARIFLEMKQSLTHKLRYLFLYSIDPDDNDELVQLKSDGDLPEEMLNVGILYLPYRDGKSLLEYVDVREEISEKNPHLLEEGNKGWELPLIIEIFFGNRRPYRDQGVDNFDWTQLFMFALLIVLPCFGYLLYKAGGRIHFRRNEQGQIVGLQYIL